MNTFNFLLLLIGACAIADAMQEKDKWRTGLCKCISGGPKPICEPKTTKPQDCNTCTCSGDGMVWDCTNKECPKPICEANDKTNEDNCNTCTCSGDGMKWYCTNRECCPGTSMYKDHGDGHCDDCFCIDTGSWSCADTLC